MSIEFLKTDFEKVSYLAGLLTSQATGKDASNSDYEALRHELLQNQNLATLLPSWLKIHRNLIPFGGLFSQSLAPTRIVGGSLQKNLIMP